MSKRYILERKKWLAFLEVDVPNVRFIDRNDSSPFQIPSGKSSPEKKVLDKWDEKRFERVGTKKYTIILAVIIRVSVLKTCSHQDKTDALDPETVRAATTNENTKTATEYILLLIL